MAEEKCVCGREGEEGACAACGEREAPAYWCDHCGQTVYEKRCPLCGLKARKMR